MKNGILSLVLSLVGCFGAYAQTAIDPTDSIALVAVWEDFRQAFADKDLTRLKALSTSQIYCSECYDNTPAEKERNVVVHHVERSQFILEDAAIISDYIGSRMKEQPYRIHNEAINRQLFTKNLARNEVSQPIVCYSVIVGIVDPSAESEGLAGLFTFVETKNGFRFCGYGTVP